MVYGSITKDGKKVTTTNGISLVEVFSSQPLSPRLELMESRLLLQRVYPKAAIGFLRKGYDMAVSPDWPLLRWINKRNHSYV